MLYDGYRSGIVRISVNGSRGTGFVVSLEKKQILTCAHVVLNENELRNGPSSRKEVELIFMGDQSKSRIRGFADPADIFTIPEGDIALVTFDAIVPPGVIALKLLDSRILKHEQKLFFFGFPDSFPDKGTDGGCEFFSRVGYEGNDDLDLLHLTKSSSADAGFSGAPLVIPDTGEVVGMLQFLPSSKHLRQNNESYSLGSDVIRYVCNKIPCVATDPIRIMAVGEIPTYLLDRQDQDDDLRTAFSNRITDPDLYVPSKDTLPLHGICLLHGPAEERPDHYIERLVKHSIEQIFLKGKDVGPPRSIVFEWPTRYTSPEDLEVKITSRIKSTLSDNKTKDNIQDLSTKIYRENNGPIVFYTIYQSKDPSPQQVLSFFQFWSKWPTRHNISRETVLAIMVMMYPPDFSLDRWTNEERKLFKDCAVEKQMCHVEFTPIENVQYSQFKAWLDRPDVTQQLTKINRLQEVASRFPPNTPPKPLGELIDIILRPQTT